MTAQDERHLAAELHEVNHNLIDVVEKLQEMCDVLRPIIDAAHRRTDAE